MVLRDPVVVKVTLVLSPLGVIMNQGLRFLGQVLILQRHLLDLLLLLCTLVVIKQYCYKWQRRLRSTLIILLAVGGLHYFR